MKTLYIDANVREESRTRILADYVVQNLGGDVKHIKLSEINLPKLDNTALKKREEDCRKRLFDDPVNDFAKDFVEADNIVLSAPFWDASFPASVKQYFETICVNHLLFEYDQSGRPHGMAKAECLYYVATSGGYMDDCTFGYEYLRYLCKGMFGLEHTHMFKAEGLDIKEADVPAILEKSKEDIDNFFTKLAKKKAKNV